MEKMFNNLGFFILALCFSILVSFGFFSAGITKVQDENTKQRMKNIFLENKIDSLENVINSEFRSKKDTIFIMVKTSNN